MIKEEFKVKGMICNKCLILLSSELKKAGAKVLEIELGSVLIEYDPLILTKEKIMDILNKNEFELLVDQGTMLGEQTKRWVVNYIWNKIMDQTLSEYLVEKQHKNYDQISRNFSKVFSKTVERYSILLKIERTKELIEYGELSFSEIAYELGYQNSSALSRQFKKEVGMSLSEYKSRKKSLRIPIDII